MCKAQKTHALSVQTPNAHLITKHLSETTGTTVTLTPMDYICYRCFRAHVSIMKDTYSFDKALQLSKPYYNVDKQVGPVVTYVTLKDIALRLNLERREDSSSTCNTNDEQNIETGIPSKQK